MLDSLDLLYLSVRVRCVSPPTRTAAEVVCEEAGILSDGHLGSRTTGSNGAVS